MIFTSLPTRPMAADATPTSIEIVAASTQLTASRSSRCRTDRGRSTSATTNHAQDKLVVVLTDPSSLRAKDPGASTMGGMEQVGMAISRRVMAASILRGRWPPLKKDISIS